MRVLRSLFLTGLTAAALGGCSYFESSTPTGVTPLLPKVAEKKSFPFPMDTTMVAVTFKDQQFKDDRPTMLISANFRGTGFSACNNWSATVLPRTDQRIVVGPIAISKRKCDERLMHNEQVFLFVFRTAQSWFYDGKVLTITSPYGAMTFQPAV